jgi:GxxExxY protein
VLINVTAMNAACIGKPTIAKFKLRHYLVENKLVVEVKAIEKLAPVHARQTLTYLRLMKLPLGLLINFGGITLKEGIKRVANNYGLLSN